MDMKMQNKGSILVRLFFVVLLVFNSPLSFSETLTLEQMWVTPTFETGQPVEKSISIETKYDYQLYAPKKGFERVNLVRRKYAGYETAHKAFIARLSAVSSLNYEWWLDTWDPSSKQLALDYYDTKGLNKDYWLKTWKTGYVGRKIKIKHMVDYQDYVILVYNVATKDGKDGYLDLPVVFKKSGDEWLVSLGIRQSPLLYFSPWVNGNEREVVVHE
jgi:hypothetical protein